VLLQPAGVYAVVVIVGIEVVGKLDIVMLDDVVLSAVCIDVGVVDE
jgi:hypothetical protein